MKNNGGLEYENFIFFMKVSSVTYQMIGNFTKNMNLESEFQNRYILQIYI